MYLLRTLHNILPRYIISLQPLNNRSRVSNLSRHDDNENYF